MSLVREYERSILLPTMWASDSSRTSHFELVRSSAHVRKHDLKPCVVYQSPS